MSRLQLFLDDTDPSIQYTPSTAWTDDEWPLWTNGHSMVPNQPSGATLQFTFNGTAANFYGAVLNNSVITVVIDDLPQTDVTLSISDLPFYGVWYQTPPDLQPNTHTVIIHDITAVMVDYIIVETDPSMMFLPNTTVLISDSDPSIEYSGNWTQETSRFQSLKPFLFRGDYSTRSSCNPGDSFSLNFSGSSVQLWGVLDWKTIGQITASYSVDGDQIAEEHYQTGPTSQNSIFGVLANDLLFSTDLSAGTHNLVVNITSCTNELFSLDYITYNLSSDEPIHSTPTKASRFPPGAIAGIVVGVVVLAVAGLTLRYYVARRKPEPVAIAPFPTPPPPVAVTQLKEEVPAHMRHLRSPPSHSTIRTKAGPSTSAIFSNEASTSSARNPPEIRHTHELAADVAPPAYPGSITGEIAAGMNIV